MANPIDLYYIPVSPPCRCVMLLARALGLNLNLKMTNIMAGEHMTPEYLKMNPEHTVPTLNDNGFIIWESRPTMAYLVETYAKDAEAQNLYPKDIKHRALVDQRLFFDAVTLFGRLAEYFGPVIRGQVTEPDEAKRIRFEEALEILDKSLESQEWVVGDTMSIADISITVTVNTAEAVGIDIKKYPNVMEWLHKSRGELAKFGYDEIELTGANMLGQFFKSKLSH